MALRDQPYLPLYVQDILTDEKLIECSAAAHGVYLRLLCILHKQETYGLLCLKQKYKQNTKQIINFATMLSKQMPFGANQIAECLQELVEENVITIKGDHLSQKRMLKDGELSTIRAKIGKTGGSIVTKQYGKAGFLYLMSDGYEKHKIGISVNPLNRLYRLRSDLKLPKHFNIVKQIAVNDMGKSEDKAHAFFKNIIDGEWLIGEYQDIIKKFDLLEAKVKANTEYEYEYEYEYENNIKEDKDKRVQGEKKKEKKTWRTDYNIYLAQLREEYTNLLHDREWLEEKKKFNPGVNIPLSLEKACVEFWATEAGWKHKKKSRSQNLDWRTTLTNALSLKSNRVYETTGNGKTTNNTRKELEDLRDLSEAVLQGIAGGQH